MASYRVGSGYTAVLRVLPVTVSKLSKQLIAVLEKPHHHHPLLLVLAIGFMIYPSHRFVSESERVGGQLGLAW